MVLERGFRAAQQYLSEIMIAFLCLVTFVGMASGVPYMSNPADDLVIGVDVKSVYRATL